MFRYRLRMLMVVVVLGPMVLAMIYFALENRWIARNHGASWLHHIPAAAAVSAPASSSRR
jgi:hypothetical protein